jgi:hypothetical protein
MPRYETATAIPQRRRDSIVYETSVALSFEIRFDSPRVEQWERICGLHPPNFAFTSMENWMGHCGI